jgi:hypothetical protein
LKRKIFRLLPIADSTLIHTPNKIVKKEKCTNIFKNVKFDWRDRKKNNLWLKEKVKCRLFLSFFSQKPISSCLVLILVHNIALHFHKLSCWGLVLSVVCCFIHWNNFVTFFFWKDLSGSCFVFCLDKNMKCLVSLLSILFIVAFLEAKTLFHRSIGNCLKSILNLPRENVISHGPFDVNFYFSSWEMDQISSRSVRLENRFQNRSSSEKRWCFGGKLF